MVKEVVEVRLALEEKSCAVMVHVQTLYLIVT